MNQYLAPAASELKRAEHIFYVSLKYTRTVDVIKNLLDRFISCITEINNGLLQVAEEKNKIFEIPDNLGLKAELVRKTYKDEKLDEMLDFYMLLRKLNRAEYKASQEFRRHVTMTVVLDDGVREINLDVSKEYFDKVKGYVEYAVELIDGKQEE